MKLYDELAEWWPLFSAPADYAEEAAFFARVLNDACEPAPRTVLELGSGGGNNALYLKSKFEMTLVDLSPQMLAVSRALNPECEHREGDMRSVNLGRTFDAVFVHDAIAYMTNADDLGAAIRTAYRHCRAGGVALFVPDCVRETFVAETSARWTRRRRRPQPALPDVVGRSRSDRHDVSNRLRDHAARTERRSARRARLSHRGNLSARRMDAPAA